MVNQIALLKILWCKRWHRCLVDAVEGELSPRAQRRFQRHLAGCQRCTADLVALQQVPARLRQMPLPGAPVWQRQQQDIMAAIQQLPGPVAATSQRWKVWSRVILQRPWRVAVASAAMFLMAGHFWWQTTTSHTTLEAFSTLSNLEVIALLDVTSSLVGETELFASADALLAPGNSAKEARPGHHADEEISWPALQDLSNDELKMLRDTLGGING